MAARFTNAEKYAHRPARSSTPAAWMALVLLGAVVGGWVFFDAIACGTLRLGFAALAWNQRVQLSIDHLGWTSNGTIQARGVALTFGQNDQRSYWKSDIVEVRLCSLGKLLGFSGSKKNHLIEELALGKTKLLLDRRPAAQPVLETMESPRISWRLPWSILLPASCKAGPADLVVIGKTYRLSVAGLNLALPDQWAGKVAYAEAVLDIGSVHQDFPAAFTPASWNGTTLRIGGLALADRFQIKELTLTPHEDRLEFGVRGTVGGGLLRGDGAVGLSGTQSRLDVTLVGENLTMQSLIALINDGDQRATGTIRQGRFTFRGDPARPLEADSSLRLVADGFRWEGRGWDSLRVAATLTGRVLTLSELSLHQKENEVEAEGQSDLPEDWHAALKAPFSAAFHAELQDAGALAALAGPEFAQLSGGLNLEGEIKGAEDKADGYCNLLGTEMKLRNLPVDWLKGCLLFEGEKTKLSYLEAWSGEDRVEMQGAVGNSGPHPYNATAQFWVGNLTKRLFQLGISTASQIGGGTVQGTWHGNGSSKGHSGSFQAKVTKWVSPWTTAGMSGSFEGTYSPGHLYCSKAELQQHDLRLVLQLSASPTLLEARSIVATREGRPDPLVKGEVSLPVNAPALWQTGDLVSNLGMEDALALHLAVHGIKAEELADLLGQHIPCSGTLEGELSASGTPGSPDIHSTLRISKMTLPDFSEIKGLTWSFDSKAGRATCHLVQDPVKDSPLVLQAELPFRLTAAGGALHLADTAAPVHAMATLHNVPMEGWVSLLYGSSWGLREGKLDGSLTLGGTLDNPSVQGSLMLDAREVLLPGMPGLSNLHLPMNCTITKATTTGGTVLYGEKPDAKPLSLAGTLDWHKTPWEGQLAFSGKELAFPKLAALESHGDAEISLGVQGTNAPMLTGNLVVRSIRGTLPSMFTPYFTPPGFVVNSPADFFEAPEGHPPYWEGRLDLQIRTEGILPLGGTNTPDPVKLQAAVQLQGSMDALRWKGKIVAQNQTIDLPAGRFVIPEATLLRNGGGREQLTYTAFGDTPLGLCAVCEDSTAASLPWFEPVTQPPGVTAADVVLALATPQNAGMNTPLFLQAGAWIRQNTLFPVPPAAWIMRHEGDYEPGALGFYGSPWSVSLQGSALDTTSLQ